MWNSKKIKLAINNLSKELHELKKTIRQPNVQITSQQHTALTNLKDLVTLLCVIRASSRGRIHLAYQEVVCEECRHCPTNPEHAVISCDQAAQPYARRIIYCPHQGPVSIAAFDSTCKNCTFNGQSVYFKMLRPMTLEFQNTWLQQNLTASLKAAYGDYVVKP